MKDLIIKDAKVVNEGKILRDTSLLIRNGIIEKIFTKVDTKNHTQQILESFEE